MLPEITLTPMAGTADDPLLVVGPSLGTQVGRLWGAVASAMGPWQVWGWDLPGHGRSPVPDGSTAGFDMAEVAQAVLARVDQSFKDSPTFAYAGDSVGGAVGLQLALDHPERITSLTVCCSAARFGTPQAWHDRAALVRAEGLAPIVESSPARWFGTGIITADDGRTSAALADLGAVDPEGYARTCEALASYDVRPRLSELKPPVLAIAGADDPVTPPAVLAEIAEAVPFGRLVVLDGVGHLAPFEDPEATAALLRSLPRA